MRLGDERVKFGLGEVVTLKLDCDLEPGMVVGVLLRASGTDYEVAWGDRSQTWHAEMELNSLDRCDSNLN